MEVGVGECYLDSSYKREGLRQRGLQYMGKWVTKNSAWIDYHVWAESPAPQVAWILEDSLTICILLAGDYTLRQIWISLTIWKHWGKHLWKIWSNFWKYRPIKGWDLISEFYSVYMMYILVKISLPFIFHLHKQNEIFFNLLTYYWRI